MNRRKSIRILYLMLLVLCDLAPAGAWRVSTLAGGTETISVKVAGSEIWTDTKIDLNAGEKILITATGSVSFAEGAKSEPEGMARGWKDLLRVLPVKDAGRGALIGRVGDFDAALPFLVGARLEMVAPIAGRLYLGVNEQSSDAANGNYDVQIQILERGEVAAVRKSGDGAGAKAGSDATYAMPVEMPFPFLTAAVLNDIPRRIRDKDGNPGDMVNFVILGSETRLKRAFQLGGWVLVDRTKADAVIHGLLSTLSKEEYVEMPMSELYLFGRPQDFGYAHADPYAVVATRHHLRVWQTENEVGGERIWAGAATHDVGFEKDQRNGSVTHKIDPEIDEEREYLARTLMAGGAVKQWSHMTPRDALKQAKTATGGNFHSDGKVLVLVLGAGEQAAAAKQ